MVSETPRRGGDGKGGRELGKGEICDVPTLSQGASLVTQLVKNPLAVRRPRFDPWVGKIPWRRERLPTPVFWPGESHRHYKVHGVAKSRA